MYHKPVLLQEAIDGLAIRPGGIYADLTYGGGGHAALILQQLGNGRLYAFDQDTEAINNKIDDERLTLIQSNFRFMRNFLRLYKAIPLDGILADLGISSHQIDKGERGFSTRYDAPLDMRMNQNTELTAHYIINMYPEQQLRQIFKDYGELQQAHILAGKICKSRVNKPLETTGQLMDIIASTVPAHRLHKTGAQVFQALRIEVNDELCALKEMLLQAAGLLKPGGRLVVIAYHSLEDRLVKNLFKAGNLEGVLEKDFFGNPQLIFKQTTRKPIVPKSEEISTNTRARSARLRTGEKIDHEHTSKQ
jgi:16S rRNA (cytosine1402-N4)-methyltransferase